MKLCSNKLALLSAFHPTSPVTNSPCCTALYNSPLNAHLSFPTDSLYVESIDSHYAANARVYPACLLHPHSATEVSEAVQLLVAADDGSPSCHFAIRGGGHTTYPGAAGAQDGVTIDMSMLNSTTYHASKSTATIEAGARWDAVYKTLKEYGVAVTGGRSDTVGVGGLIIGGGLSYFAARDGFVCDTIENIEIVLASGEIINTNVDSYPDLFRVQKGGANNFGIVTKIEIRTFEQGDLWGGIIVHDMTSFGQQLSALVNFTNRVDEDTDAALVSFWTYSAALGKTIGASAPQYLRAVAEPDTYREFLQIPRITDSLRFADIYDLMMETAPPAGQRVILMTLTFGNDERVLRKLVDIQTEVAEEVKPYMKSSNWDFTSFLQPFPKLFGENAKKNGGNILGLERMKKNHLVYLMFLGWEESVDDSLVRYAGDKILKQIREYSKSIGQDSDYIYMNYAHNSQNPLRSYGEENFHAIQRAATTYDPTGVFQYQSPGGFKVSRA